MKLRNVGSNMTEVETDKARILFSYSTPVAAYVQGRGYVKTAKHYSTTTTRHINKWLRGANAEEEAQEYIDNLV